MVEARNAAFHPTGQAVALALLIGFVAMVIVIHVIEFVWLSLTLRAWMLSLIGVASVLVCCGGGSPYLIHHLRAGPRLPDALALLGAQMALTVCLPARLIRWRIRQCAQHLHLARTPVNARPLLQRTRSGPGLLGGRRLRN